MVAGKHMHLHLQLVDVRLEFWGWGFVNCWADSNVNFHRSSSDFEPRFMFWLEHSSVGCVTDNCLACCCCCWGGPISLCRLSGAASRIGSYPKCSWCGLATGVLHISQRVNCYSLCLCYGWTRQTKAKRQNMSSGNGFMLVTHKRICVLVWPYCLHKAYRWVRRMCK